MRMPIMMLLFFLGAGMFAGPTPLARILCLLAVVGMFVATGYIYFTSSDPRSEYGMIMGGFLIVLGSLVGSSLPRHWR